jgi:type II secretory pathway component GspD/PulD (secretin)
MSRGNQDTFSTPTIVPAAEVIHVQLKTAPAAAPKAKPKVVIPKMALIDVAIIRTEEIYRTGKGVNLLNGLNIFFTGDQIFQTKTPFGLGRVRTDLTTNDTITLKLGTAGAGLTYSLNIFNSNYDRNEVMARPTILVEDQKKSSFFSGSTLHIVLEGGVAGSGSMQPINTGVKLEVTPKFLDAETLDMNVFAQRTFLEAGLSQVSDTITGTSFAQTSKTTISANLTLRYGETMVLSGLSD